MVGWRLVLAVSAMAAVLGQAALAQSSCESSCQIQHLSNCSGSDTATLCERRYDQCVQDCYLQRRSSPYDPGPVTPVPRGGWGAAAMSADGRTLGWGLKSDTRQIAENSAIMSCRQNRATGCRVVQVFRNTCIVFAFSDAARAAGLTPWWFTATGGVRYGVEQDALSICRDNGRTDCKITNFKCSGQNW